MAEKGGGAVPADYRRQNTEDYEELPLKIPVSFLCWKIISNESTPLPFLGINFEGTFIVSHLYVPY